MSPPGMSALTNQNMLDAQSRSASEGFSDPRVSWIWMLYPWNQYWMNWRSTSRYPWELTHDNPIVDIRLLCQRQFGLAFLVMLAVGAILYGSNQITPQLMQTNFPYTAMLSGLAMMPGGIAMIVMMPLVGQIAGHVQPKYMIAIGFTVIALAMWINDARARCELYLFRDLARISDGRHAVHVHSDQHGRLYRIAAAKNRASLGAD